MPFSVSPSNSVVIAGQSITKDDFLKVILENGEVLYVRSLRDSDDAFLLTFTFDEEFLPASLAGEINLIVATWYRRYYLGSALYREKFHAHYKNVNRRKGGFRAWVRSRLASTIYIRRNVSYHYEGIPLDIGYEIGAIFNCLIEDGRVIDAHNDEDYRNNWWTASAPIAAILSTTRAEIREEIAAK